MTHSPAVQTRHDDLVAQGREALLAGDKAHAQALLSAAVELDPRSEEGWIWLSGTQSSLPAMAECLHRVLEINPHNHQAQEGLRWIAEQAAAAAPPAPSGAALPAPDLHPVRLVTAPAYGIGMLLEAALHPFAAGAFLGLLRLVSWLRPTTLSLLRGDAGPMGAAGSVGLVIVTALAHGTALLVLWLIMAIQLSRVRGNARGDRFDSLIRVGQLWQAGYVWVVALIAAGLGLGLSPGPWRIVALLCWALLLLGAALVAGRLWRLLDQLAVPAARRVAVGGRLIFTLLLGAVIGLGLAGIVSQALLT